MGSLSGRLASGFSGSLSDKKNNTMKLTLETDYTRNGNSTGCGIDTLALAVDGRDSNDIDIFNIEAIDASADYVLEHYDYETDMLKTASKEQLREWLEDADKQEEALKEYKERAREAIYDGSDYESELAKEVQKARDDAADDNYKEWLYGDYHGNWSGILSMAEKRYGVPFTTEKGEVYADIDEEVAKEWKEEGYIDSTADALQYLEGSINADAWAQFAKKKERNEKARAERERIKAYKEEQAVKAEAKRRERLQALIEKR